MWTFILLLCEMYLLAGCQVTLTHNSASALADTFICGTNTQFTCTIDPAPGFMSWVKESATLTECAGAMDACVDATVDNYQFTSNVTVKEFYLTVNPVMFSNAGTFTCSNGASVDDSKTISIAAVPNAITMTLENGTGTITLQVTTDCAFPMSDVSIEWYYLKELTDTPQLYTDAGFTPVRTEDSSTCTSGDCTSGVGVSKVVSTVTFNENENSTTAYYLQAKMEHKAALSNSSSVVVITTKKYFPFVVPEKYGCPGLGNSTAFNNKNKCAGSWFGIAVGICLCLFIIGWAIECIFSIWGDLGLVARVELCVLIVGLGLLVCWAMRGASASKSDKYDTSKNIESTRSSPKNAKSKSLNEKKQSSATGKADGGNKGKRFGDTQNQYNDKSQNVHPENEEKPFRPQPLPPPGANINHSLAEDNHGTGAGDSFSLTKLPPIQNTPRTDKPN